MIATQHNIMVRVITYKHDIGPNRFAVATITVG